MAAVEAAQPGAGSGSAGPTLGLWACTALVIGNVVGSGFFLSPAALAPYGGLAIVGWLVMAVVAICLGLIFARLARIAPDTGGPYAYTRLGFGPFAGFLIAWGYWISIWAGLPAIALALVGYLEAFLPALGRHPAWPTAIALAAIWLVALVNLRGVGEAGRLQIVIIAVKLVPFSAVAFLGLFWVDWSHFTPLNPTPQPFLIALAAVAPLTMFAFIGIESATVPAGDVRNPTRTIPRATVIGTLVCALLFVFGTVAVMGVVPPAALAQSTAPFTDAADAMWGGWAGGAIAVAAILSSIAALNGWTLLMGQVPMAAARHGVLPEVFAELNRRGVPAKGLLISVGLATVLTLAQGSGVGSMVSLYDFVVDLSTVADMVPYVFCALVEGVLFFSISATVKPLSMRSYVPLAVVAFVFSLWTIYGAGPQAGMWGLLLLLAGLPVYMLMQKGRRPAADGATEGREPGA